MVEAVAAVQEIAGHPKHPKEKMEMAGAEEEEEVVVVEEEEKKEEDLS